MADSKDNQYSRAPELEDVVFICRSLNEAGAKYILIGGFAVILQGAARFTKDIDLLVDPSVENVKKLKKALSQLPDNAIALIEDDEVEKYVVVRVADEVVIDLMAKACGINYEEAINEVEYKELEGILVPVPTKELLIRTKNTYRPMDQADILFLKSELSVPETKKSQSLFKKIIHFFER